MMCYVVEVLFRVFGEFTREEEKDASLQGLCYPLIIDRIDHEVLVG